MGGGGSKADEEDVKPRRIDFRRLFPPKGHAPVTAGKQKTKKEKATKVLLCFISLSDFEDLKLHFARVRRLSTRCAVCTEHSPAGCLYNSPTLFRP